MRSIRSILCFAILLVACKGADGATGPTGATGQQGAQGQAGPAGLPGPAVGTRFIYTGKADPVGTAHVDLPTAAGTITNPPVLTCYTAASSNGLPTDQWVAIGSGPNVNLRCGIAANANGSLYIWMNGNIPSWPIAFVVVY